MATNVVSDEIELIRFDSIYNIRNPLLSSESIDLNDDASSVVDTSRSGSSINFFNSRTKEVNSIPKYNPIEPSKTYIGSASVVDSENVLFGTIFNGPVAITNLITDKKDVRHNSYIRYNEKSDPLRNSKTRTEQTSQGTYRNRVLYFKNKRRLMVLILASAVVLLAVIIVVRYYLDLTDGGVEKGNIPNPSNGYEGGYGYELIVRQQYRALPSKIVIKPLKLPIRRVIVAHTATPNCTDYLACVSRILEMQNYHMNANGWDDIAYNFLVGGDGRVYEGRGYKVGAHTKDFYEGSLCVAFIGNFTLVEASEEQLKTAHRFIDDGVQSNKIVPDYALYGHRQLRKTESPGTMLYHQIMSWPHWSKDIIPL